MSTFWRATLTWFNVNTGLFAQNVLFLEDASTTKTPATIAAAIENSWWGPTASTGLRAMSSFHTKLLNISLQKVSPAPAGGTIPIAGSNSAGNIGTGVVHPVVGFCFTLLDGQAGKQHRGRIYHTGTPSTLVLNGAPSPSAATAFATLRDSWLNSFGPLPTTDLFWNLFHRNAVGAAQFTRIVDIRLNNFLRVQRRRNYGVGM